jgi:hypothetical protein
LKRLIFTILVAAFFSSNIAFAQEFNFGSPANQAVQIQIDEEGNAYVKHVVEKSRNSQQISVISDNFYNFTIADVRGGEIDFAEVSGETMTLLIFPTDINVVMEYVIDKAVTEENGLWTWNYLYPASTTFFMPKDVEFVLANSIPVPLQEVKGIRCHGCQLKLEYEERTSEKIQQITWEDKSFDVRILATGTISELRFDQPNKMISIDVEKNQYVTLVIPKELLWNPYEVLLNDKPIVKYEFYQTDKEAWLNFKPNENGTVTIIGVSAVPEFPLATILVLGAAMVVVAKLSSRFNRR